MGEKIPILIEEGIGISRNNEPIIVGIPLKKGFLFNKNNIYLFNKNKPIPLQTKILAIWPDKSIKWLLLDFQANVKARKTTTYYLKKYPNKTKDFNINKDLINNIKFILTDKKGIKHIPKIKKSFLVTNGNLRKALRIEGNISSLEFIARFNFFADSSLIKLQFTVRNPKPAIHKGGFWDLGDPNSCLFKDLSIKIKTNKSNIFWKDQPKTKLKQADNILIYQDSSGGKNWKNKNHVNRNNKVMLSFKGYKVFENNEEIKKGNRAQPVVRNNNITASIKDFWQNFPKALEAENNSILIRLFPKYYNDLHELQPGEQKTHTIFIDFNNNNLDWTQFPLLARSTPEYYTKTKAIPYLNLKNDKKYQQLISNIIEGKNNFFNKREIIDEYGWRNFGEVYADHEAIHQKGLISHYNNQYDVVYGLFLQYLKSGNKNWFELANDLANHVIDIDIYHTNKDKAAYNQGMFWHTFHYTNAYTSTHRSFSKLGTKEMKKSSYGIGGGPSNEHNYARGLMYHYFLTGNHLAKEAVISLADWVINMDDGKKSKLRFLNHKPTGKASSTYNFYYHGPGRGAGNSINTLIDGFEVTNNKKCLLKAEQLIRRCVHPKENISKHDLQDIENKWSYLVFLQALGKYLDLKLELNQKDYMYYYTRESLIHYAKYMLKNEVPYKEVLNRVDIPTETWPAQDIRKSIVFDFAAKFAKEELSKRFINKSKFFYNKCIKDLNSFKTKTLTRPLAIIMNFSFMHKKINHDPKNINFGKPKKFKPQGYYIHKIKDMIK